MKARKSPLDRGKIADTGYLDAKADDKRRDDCNTGERGRDGPRDARCHPDDRHGRGNKRQHGDKRPARHPDMAARAVGQAELLKLRKADHDSKPVDKAQHHRMRHQTNELAELQKPRRDLDEPHQHHGREEIFGPMRRDEADHHHRQRPGRPRDHAGPPADQRRDQPDKESRIKADQRVHPRDKGKGHRLRHQRQRHGKARQKLGPKGGDGMREGRCMGRRHGSGKGRKRGAGHLEILRDWVCSLALL